MRRLLVVVSVGLLGLGVTCGTELAALVGRLERSDAVTFVTAPFRPELRMADRDAAQPLDPELAALGAKVTPSLVELTVFDSSGTPVGQATGVVLDSSGLVVTNHHVVADAAEVIATRSLHDWRAYPATVVGADLAQDIAVLRLRDASSLPAARLGDSDALRINQRVAMIGNGWGSMEVGAGPVTRLRLLLRRIPAEGMPRPRTAVLYDMIEARTGGNPGDSGGALVTTDGAVIGINQGVASGSGYAIPINKVLRVVERLTATTYR
ncbi:S1-C subfamily serine protease [Pseudonocardia eucalypti]|nr:S1-C subfamily serine protease [Pseudonocardia eucalypti]